MPIYAYKCESCGHAKDVLQKMSDPLLTDCPACGAPAFKKQLTAAGFQLKGSGWYATDFKNGGSNTAAPGGEKSESAAVTKTDTTPGESKSESKTETKAESKVDSNSASKVESKPTPSVSSSPPAASGGCSSGCGCH